MDKPNYPRKKSNKRRIARSEKKKKIAEVEKIIEKMSKKIDEILDKRKRGFYGINEKA